MAGTAEFTFQYGTHIDRGHPSLGLKKDGMAIRTVEPLGMHLVGKPNKVHGRGIIHNDVQIY